jgi:hypothetical protein
LSEEQLHSVAEKMEAGVAEAERAKHEELQARRTSARQEREQTERLVEQEKPTAQRVPKDAERSLDAATRMVEDNTTAVATNVFKITDVASPGMQGAIEKTTETVSSRLTVASDLPSEAVYRIADRHSDWVEALGRATISGAQMSQNLFWEAAERHQQFTTKALFSWADRNARIMRSAMNFAAQGCGPFLSRLATAPRGSVEPQQ